MKTKLIAVESTLYKKRMVRELNRCYDGFHTSVENGKQVFRCNGARVSLGILQVRLADGSGEWIDANGCKFFRPSVEEVVASREP